MPELLIPAGDLERLETAIRFGADAVYVGAGPYSLRAQVSGFGNRELETGIKIAHKNKVKIYLAMNIYAYDEDLSEMIKYLEKAVEAGIDGVIVSDPGLIHLINQKHKKLKLHLSTQANTINSEAVKFWTNQGIQRIVLGREVSLAQAKKIKQENPNIEIELFVHGAMCISYAGRCLLSKHMTGRSANRGECTQPCRWEYRMKEQNRPNEEFTVEQDWRSTYILNSKDLCMIEHIQELIDSGIDSFKVEGRMKSPYYVALVAKIYRKAIDNAPHFDPEWKTELEKISHRQYTTGFYFGEDDREKTDSSKYIRDYDFVGVVEGHNENEIEIKARNFFGVGDELEIIDPKVDEIRRFKVNKIRTIKNEQVDKAHNEYHVFVDSELKGKVSKYSLLRRKR
ncbi:MAG: U32 family peptidase C-terminal domain-containing protein [Candidatus Saganbacteria bacterium]|nr:U32 family peptidase C-terminal domain-containing protein [Candidatus Saganbacteria bacterium]